MLATVVLWLLLVGTRVLADLAVVEPTEGSNFKANLGAVSVTVQWEDMGDSPDLSTVTQYIFTLCSGPNGNIQSIATLAKASRAEVGGAQYTVKIPNSIGTNGRYFIQVVAISPIGYSIHYSGRFALSGMIGTVIATSALETLGPKPQTVITTGGVPAAIDSASFFVTYALQTGVSRFAPMQLQPGTTVTATSWRRQHPTSSVLYYSTPISNLQQMTTITPGWNYTMTTLFNWETPAPFPSDNGGWYDARDRMTLTTRKLNRKRLSKKFERSICSLSIRS